MGRTSCTRRGTGASAPPDQVQLARQDVTPLSPPTDDLPSHASSFRPLPNWLKKRIAGDENRTRIYGVGNHVALPLSYTRAIRDRLIGALRGPDFTRDLSTFPGCGQPPLVVYFSVGNVGKAQYVERIFEKTENPI